MAARGWTGISLKEDLAGRIDNFLETNTLGFTSRADVVAAAVREFLERRGEGKT